MNKKIWTWIIVIAIVFGTGIFYAGMKYQKSRTPKAVATGGSGRYAGASGVVELGTVFSISPGSLIVQLPNSTSTNATTGTNIVILSSTTKINELEFVATSTLAVGQNVTVAGTANSDGSITASTIQIRQARSAEVTGSTPNSGQ